MSWFARASCLCAFISALFGIIIGCVFMFNETPKEKSQLIEKKEVANEPLTNWKTTMDFIKNKDNSVQLTVIDAVETNEPVQVLFVNNNKEYNLGWISFYPKGISKSSFIFDLGQILEKIDEIPNDDAKIVLKTKSGRNVSFKKAEVKLVKHVNINFKEICQINSFKDKA